MIEKVEIQKLKKGRFIVVDGEPCRIVGMDMSAPGKHGHAKYRVDAIGLFDGKKRQFIVPSGHKVDVPIVDKRTGQVLSVMGKTVQLMDSQSYETFEVELPDDFTSEIAEGSEISYWEILGKKLLKEVK